MPLLVARGPELVPFRNLALGLLAVGALAAIVAPPLFWLLLAGIAAAGLLFLVWRHLAVTTGVWLIVTGMTLEMVLIDLVGPGAFAPTIATVKATGLLLAGMAILRYGARFDVFNPALFWTAMFCAGLAHGLWPDLSAGESLRSLVGSVAPFAFGFSRLSRAWAHAVIRTCRWIPTIAVAAGSALAAVGLHPLFIASGGERLAGLGHPAFLAGISQVAVYASLIEFYRAGRRSEFLLVVLNLCFLLLTGARAPLTCAVAVVALTLALVRSPAVPAHRRLALCLIGLTTLPLVGALILGVFPVDVFGVRAFTIVATDLDNLSGRQFLWPNFQQAASMSPWFGWGVGAGNVIIPPESNVARLLHTWAAHNEYLRVAVEGGTVGQILLVGSLVLWVRGHTMRLVPYERYIMRLVFLGLAIHAMTDNVLISTPACVLFAFATAVFARGRLESECPNPAMVEGGPPT